MIALIMQGAVQVKGRLFWQSVVPCMLNVWGDRAVNWNNARCCDHSSPDTKWRILRIPDFKHYTE